MILWLLAAVVLLIWHFFFRRCHPIDELDGPATVPFFGNLLSFTGGREGKLQCCRWIKIIIEEFR
jgi:hypothetical protein